MTDWHHSQDLLPFMDAHQSCGDVLVKEACYPARIEPHGNRLEHDPFSRIPGPFLSVRTFHVAHDGEESTGPFYLAIRSYNPLEHEIGRSADKDCPGIRERREVAAQGSEPLFRFFRQGLPVEPPARTPAPYGLIPSFKG
jgi:hypothetical protein